jgi:DNA adenine methylase
MKPIIKWQGGKTQLLVELKKRFPSNYNDYYEPFIGGASVLFDIMPNKAYINDFNPHVTGLYKVLAGNSTDFNLLKTKLLALETQFNALTTDADRLALYLSYRVQDTLPTFFTMTEVDKATRFVFLNKTGFNGRYRENAKGHFNIPYGGYKKVKLVTADFDLIHQYFTSTGTVITTGDFAYSLTTIKSGDFIYMDPPYDPIVATELNYTAAGFSATDQQRVRDEMDRATQLGVYCVASNHDTVLIRQLYAGYRIDVVQARRSINVKGNGRGPVSEVIIMNFDPTTGAFIVPQRLQPTNKE